MTIMSFTAPQIFHSQCENDTADIARRLAAILGGGDIVSLEGDLGAGKTFLARQLARELGITTAVTSPTFVIQKVYPVPTGHHGITQLAHYDLYRLTDYQELLDLGFEDHDVCTLVLVEWGNLFAQDLPPAAIRIELEATGIDSRKITIYNAPLIG